MSRLSIEVSPEQHQQIKALAALQGKSIREFVLNQLFKTDEESEKVAMAELKKLLAARVEEAKKSEPIKQSFMDIYEDRVNELEE